MAEQETSTRSFLDIPQSKLPEHLRADPRAVLALHRQIEEGEVLNGAQIQFALALVRYCIAYGLTFKKTFGAVALQELKNRSPLKGEDVTLCASLEGNDVIKACAAELLSVRKETSIVLGGGQADTQTKKERVADPTEYIAKMKTALASKNFDRATEIAEECARIHPRFPQVLYMAGYCHFLRTAQAPESPELSYRDLQFASTYLRDCLTLVQEAESRGLHGFSSWKVPAEQLLTKIGTRLPVLARVIDEADRKAAQVEAEQKKKKKT